MFKTLVLGWLAAGTLLLPAKPAKTASDPTSYTVRKGDSLYTIAKSLHTTVGALRESNGLEEGALLHPGQKLKIPVTRSRATPAKKSSGKTTAEKNSKSTPNVPARPALRLYTVQAGDTPSTIAREHGISTRELLRANRMKPDSLIRVGQALVIPVPAETSKRSTALKAAKSPKRIVKRTEKTPSKKQAKKNGAGTTVVHVVAYGDTLFSIARKYKTPLKDLMALNGIQPTDVIHPGQKLKIPGNRYRSETAAANSAKKKRTPKKKKVEPLIYTVKHGDTLWEIAHKHRVTVSQIRRLNKMKRRDIIRTGMKLLIKEGSPSASASALAKAKKSKEPKKIEKYYTVKKGDSLWLIAKRNKTSVAELRKLNGMKRGEIIRTGMKLKVGYEKVPPTRLAKKSEEKPSGKTVSKKSSTKKKHVAKKTEKKKKTQVASTEKKTKSPKSSHRKKADRRINSALAALNGKSSRHGGGGGDYNVIRTAKRFLGRRYVWGAEGPSCFDCSGFTQYVMRKSKGVKIPRVSRKQAYYGKYVTRSQLKPGDLIFFDTSRRRRGYVNHVGIYIGNGKFIHASSARHRVVITSLNSPFYRARFKWGRRIN